MPRTMLRALLLLLWIGIEPVFGQSASPAEIPAQEFGRLPQVAGMAISPDGTKIAEALNTPEFSVVAIVDLESAKMVYGARTQEDQVLRGVDWIDSDLARYTFSTTIPSDRAAAAGYYFTGARRQLEYFRTGTADLKTRKQVLLMDREADSWADTNLSYVLAPIEGDPGFGRMISRTSPDAGAKLAVFRVNLRSGSASVTATATPKTRAIELDPSGKIVASIDTLDEKANIWALYAHGEGPRRKIAEGQSLTGLGPALFGLAADGRLITSNAYDDEALEGDTDKLIAVDLKTGEKSVFFEIPGFDVDGVIMDPHTHLIIGARYTDAFTERQHFFDSTLVSYYEAIQDFFADGEARLIDWSRDRARFIVYGRTSELSAGNYYLFEPADRKLTRITSDYPDLPEAAISPVQSIKFKARDGVRIPGYLTVPRGREAKNLPLILLVHGGPHSRDVWQYDFWSQFLASRGYAVLQPNFRGSSGFGRKWESAGKGQWGGLMQTDAEDGVAALIKAGMVDGSRVCIMGASYGGYAALAGITLTPDRYACAVSVNGVSDLELMLRRTKENSGGNSSVYDFWRGSMGDPSTALEKLRAASPVHLAQAVKAPVLVVYSTEDSVVPAEQPKAMINALKAANKNVQTVVLKGDDHWFSTWDGRTQFLVEIDRFLKEKMPPG